MWLRYPSWRVLCLSSNPRVAMRDAMLCRDLIESPWYQNRFSPSWRLRDDQNAKSLYWTTAGGFRTSLGRFAKVTGDRADAIFPDDPHDAIAACDFAESLLDDDILRSEDVGGYASRVSVHPGCATRSTNGSVPLPCRKAARCSMGAISAR